MKIIKYAFVILIVMYTVQLFSQGGEISSENFADRLSYLSSQNDPCFQEAYGLINIQLPRTFIYDSRNPDFRTQTSIYQQAEQRYFRYEYLLGQIKARNSLVYETIKQLKKLKSEYIKNNPMPSAINSDMRLSMSDQIIIRQGQIRQKIAAYDNAIRFATNFYAEQTKRYKNLAESSNAKTLIGFILSYNQNVLRKTEKQIRIDILHRAQHETNRGEKDAGGISNLEYRARTFSLNVLLPIFDSVKGTQPVDSLPSAVAKILSALSKINP